MDFTTFSGLRRIERWLLWSSVLDLVNYITLVVLERKICAEDHIAQILISLVSFKEVLVTVSKIKKRPWACMRTNGEFLNSFNYFLFKIFRLHGIIAKERGSNISSINCIFVLHFGALFGFVLSRFGFVLFVTHFRPPFVFVFDSFPFFQFFSTFYTLRHYLQWFVTNIVPVTCLILIYNKVLL